MKNSKPELLSTVKLILETLKESRDCDAKLISYVWAYEVEDILTISAQDLLMKLANSLISNPESIRRRRQLLQAKYPELRGARYKERQVYSKKYKDDIKSGQINELA